MWLETHFFEPSAVVAAGGPHQEGGLRAVSRLARGQQAEVEKRGCWDRGLVGNQGDSYCSHVDSPAAAAGRAGAAQASWAARPWVSALPAWWRPPELVAEVQGDHCGLGW